MVDGETIATIQPTLERAERLVVLLMRDSIPLAVGKMSDGKWRIEVRRMDARNLWQASVLVGD